MGEKKQVKVIVSTDPRFLMACPAICLSQLKHLLPAKLTKLVSNNQMTELNLRTGTYVISGVIMLDSCPTRMKATYMELYLGYFIPFLVKPDLQAVFYGKQLVSCRYGMQKLRLNEECRFESVKFSISPDVAIRIIEKLRKLEPLPRNIPLVLLFTPEEDHIHVLPKGRGFRR